MIIQLLDGTEIDVWYDYELQVLGHNIPSLEIVHDTETVYGRDGSLFLGSNFSDRSISVRFLYESENINNYYLIRDRVNQLFARKETFYIIFKDVPLKRWKVRLAKSFEVKPNQFMEAFEIEFKCVNVFAESIVNTRDPNFQHIFSYQTGSPWDQDLDLSYTFDSNEFIVDNIGNVLIDPRQHEIEIVIKATASSYLEIKNNTTGDVYRYNGALTTNDTLTLSGIQSFKNGISVFKDTNKKLLRLNEGKNSFTVTGGTVISAAFNLRFLYL